MVLRKPYKFFIKHFRLIHFILAIINGYLLIKTNAIIKFFNDYLNSTNTLVGSGTSNEYFSNVMFLLIGFMLIGTFIIAFIMKRKDKPILFYIINFILFVIIGIIYSYDNSIIETLEIQAVEIRNIKLASDLSLICFLLQCLSTIILTIRSIGFNIKKFNFDRDLKLDISESDNEEFEFEVSFDKNKIKRNVKKNIRNIKYTYHENKIIINSMIIVFLIIIGLLVFLNFNVYNKVYKEGKTINTNLFSYSLENSYLINTDYKGNIITDNYLVALKIKIKNNTNNKIALETGRILLHIGKTIYKPITDYKNKLIDLGENYVDQKIYTDYEEYLLVFEVPKNYISKKMILSYQDTNDKIYKIKLNNITFNNNKETSGNINEFIELNDELVKNVKFKISEYEINDKISATYNFCETKNKCYESYEYLYPTLTDNYSKDVLKITSEFEASDMVIKNKNDLSELIENFGTIEYSIDGKGKVMNTKIKKLIPKKSNKKGIYYFEIYNDIKHADSITLVITLRNNIYKYKLK